MGVRVHARGTLNSMTSVGVGPSTVVRVHARGH